MWQRIKGGDMSDLKAVLSRWTKQELWVPPKADQAYQQVCCFPVVFDFLVVGIEGAWTAPTKRQLDQGRRVGFRPSRTRCMRAGRRARQARRDADV